MEVSNKIHGVTLSLRKVVMQLCTHTSSLNLTLNPKGTTLVVIISCVCVSVCVCVVRGGVHNCRKA